MKCPKFRVPTECPPADLPQVYKHKFAVIFRKAVNPKDAPGYEKVRPVSGCYLDRIIHSNPLSNAGMMLLLAFFCLLCKLLGELHLTAGALYFVLFILKVALLLLWSLVPSAAFDCV